LCSEQRVQSGARWAADFRNPLALGCDKHPAKNASMTISFQATAVLRQVSVRRRFVVAVGFPVQRRSSR